MSSSGPSRSPAKFFALLVIIGVLAATGLYMVTRPPAPTPTPTHTPVVTRTVPDVQGTPVLLSYARRYPALLDMWRHARPVKTEELKPILDLVLLKDKSLFVPKIYTGFTETWKKPIEKYGYYRVLTQLGHVMYYPYKHVNILWDKTAYVATADIVDAGVSATYMLVPVKQTPYLPPDHIWWQHVQRELHLKPAPYTYILVTYIGVYNYTKLLVFAARVSRERFYSTLNGNIYLDVSLDMHHYFKYTLRERSVDKINDYYIRMTLVTWAMFPPRIYEDLHGNLLTRKDPWRFYAVRYPMVRMNQYVVPISALFFGVEMPYYEPGLNWLLLSMLYRPLTYIAIYTGSPMYMTPSELYLSLVRVGFGASYNTTEYSLPASLDNGWVCGTAAMAAGIFYGYYLGLITEDLSGWIDGQGHGMNIVWFPSRYFGDNITRILGPRAYYVGPDIDGDGRNDTFLGLIDTYDLVLKVPSNPEETVRILKKDGFWDSMANPNCSVAMDYYLMVARMTGALGAVIAYEDIALPGYMEPPWANYTNWFIDHVLFKYRPETSIGWWGSDAMQTFLNLSSPKVYGDMELDIYHMFSPGQYMCQINPLSALSIIAKHVHIVWPGYYYRAYPEMILPLKPPAIKIRLEPPDPCMLAKPRLLIIKTYYVNPFDHFVRLTKYMIDMPPVAFYIPWPQKSSPAYHPEPYPDQPIYTAFMHRYNAWYFYDKQQDFYSIVAGIDGQPMTWRYGYIYWYWAAIDIRRMGWKPQVWLENQTTSTPWKPTAEITVPPYRPWTPTPEWNTTVVEADNLPAHGAIVMGLPAGQNNNSQATGGANQQTSTTTPSKPTTIKATVTVYPVTRKGTIEVPVLGELRPVKNVTIVTQLRGTRIVDNHNITAIIKYGPSKQSLLTLIYIDGKLVFKNKKYPSPYETVPPNLWLPKTIDIEYNGIKYEITIEPGKPPVINKTLVIKLPKLPKGQWYVELLKTFNFEINGSNITIIADCGYSLLDYNESAIGVGGSIYILGTSPTKIEYISNITLSKEYTGGAGGIGVVILNFDGIVAKGLVNTVCYITIQPYNLTIVLVIPIHK